MKRYLAIIVATLLIVPYPQWSWAKRGLDCRADGEDLELSSGDRPQWIDKLHSNDAKNEYFVGMSTQNEKLEHGKDLAVEAAKLAIVESIGEIYQRKDQGILTMEDNVVHNSYGSLKAPTFLKHTEVSDWYSEKWVSSSNCKTKHFYNVWVLIAMPKSEYDTEKGKSVAYLEKAQNKELGKEAPALLPETQLTKEDIVKETKTQKYKFNDISQEQVNAVETRINNFGDTPKKKHVLLWTLLGIVLLSAASVGIYYGMSGGGGGSSSAGGGYAGAYPGGGNGGGSGDISIRATIP